MRTIHQVPQEKNFLYLIQSYHQWHGQDTKQSGNHINGTGVIRILTIYLSHLCDRGRRRGCHCQKGYHKNRHALRNQPGNTAEF